MIKGIIFDLGGVILPDNNEEVLKKFAKQFKIDFELLKKMLLEDNDNLALGKLSIKEFLTRVRNRFELEEDSFTLQMAWDKVYVESTPINEELLIEAKKLKPKYILSLITNSYDSTARINQSRRIFYNFKPVLLSCRTGIVKPDIKIFARALHEMQIKGSECILIDDKEANIASAKEFGMKTVLYKDNKQLMKDLKKLGVKPDKVKANKK